MTEGDAAVDTDVTIWPSDVMMNVTNDGEGVTVGIAVALGWRVFKAGMYVLAPKPVDMILPVGAGIELLNK